MQILSAEQVKAWDNYTISNEPISSIELMERAAGECAKWLKKHLPGSNKFLIFCGKGNNGADGLAIARMLLLDGYNVSVYILEFGKTGCDNFQANLQRLHDLPNTAIHFIQPGLPFPGIEENFIVIDALFGTGLNKPLDKLTAALVTNINSAGVPIISIDLPSGLYADVSSKDQTIIRATITLTFQCYKPALLLQENALYIGNVQVLDIGLTSSFLQQLTTPYHLLDEKMVRKIFVPRNKFSHKGNHGHALIVAGSFGKMGAAALCVQACLRGGAGLTTALIPRSGHVILQTLAPEAMLLSDDNETHLTGLPGEIEKFTSIAIGPGIGTLPGTQKMISYIIRRYQSSLVIDADALNCIAINPLLLEQLQPFTILTPHPKEFDRLFGLQPNDFERLQMARNKSAALNIIIVLKGHHTTIVLPDGTVYFNSTGNAGMAKGGSGDVLTGIIGALLAQGYKPEQAAMLGVYMHGWAGDFAAVEYGKESMLATHIIQHLSSVILAMQ